MYQFQSAPTQVVYLSPQHGYDQSLKQTIKKQHTYEDPKIKAITLLGENKKLTQ